MAWPRPRTVGLQAAAAAPGSATAAAFPAAATAVREVPPPSYRRFRFRPRIPSPPPPANQWAPEVAAARRGSRANQREPGGDDRRSCSSARPDAELHPARLPGLSGGVSPSVHAAKLTRS